MADPSFVLELQRFLRGRLAERTEGSYSVRVMTDRSLAQRKLMEEAFEVCLEVQAGEVDGEALATEAADLVFHLTALLTGAGVGWDEVEAVLRDRHGRPARDSTYAGDAVDGPDGGDGGDGGDGRDGGVDGDESELR